MSGSKISDVHIDTAALEQAMQEDPETRKAVNRRSSDILSSSQGMSAGFKTGRFYDRDDKELRGGKSPEYGRKPATEPNPHSIVYTANYAAMKFEHDNNGLLKASR